MKNYFILFLLLVTSFTWGQEDAWVYFTDKPEVDYYLANPDEMLTERALTRRANQGISVDEIDVPISEDYISQIEAVSGIEVKAKSKWLNAVHVQGSEAGITGLSGFSFVSSIEFANLSIGSLAPIPIGNNISETKLNTTLTDFEYGTATNQIEMLGGDFLHENDYTGEGMLIAVIDAGFQNVNSMNAFSRIRNNGQILGVYNFVNRNEDVYTSGTHGTAVLSTIAGYVEGAFVGTAPDADFYLFVSEDLSQEHILEESLWVEAAEEADRLGVDVINTSLGYSDFDRPEYSHTYSDMDGMTTFISRGAEIATSRGMIVVNSAGNSGNNDWHYITAPADAEHVLTVGAVYADETITGFSSYGPSSDGRVKPDVCAQGGIVAVINYNDEITESNGTSFSSPIMTGVVTCLWQAFPEMTANQIVEFVKQSSDRFSDPDDQYGYGIPDFELAFQALKENEHSLFEIGVYPNPIMSHSDVYLEFGDVVNDFTIELIDDLGKVVFITKVKAQSNTIQLPSLAEGLYIIQIRTVNTIARRKLLVE